MTEDFEHTLAAANEWAKGDPDQETQDELLGEINRATAGDLGSQKLLTTRFGARLTFGTAGIRGPLGFGPGAMNRVVVCQTTAGLAQFLLSHSVATSPLRVIVGFDARKNSAIFARDTAEVLAGYGIEVLLTPGHVPTPIVAFGVRHLACDAGIMVTASHNPATDNGYKVYFGGADMGSQIIPPADHDIEEQIRLIAATMAFGQIPRNPELVGHTPATLLGEYTKATVSSVQPLTTPKTPITAVYTAMHGVGGETFLALLEAAGFSTPVLVDQQFQPDPRFPTVAFPNPEELGALDLAFSRARDVGADIILAHDPDADRLAVALRDQTRGAYYSLTGNQVGAILGWWSADRNQESGKPGTLANSIVSSPVLGKIAEHFSLNHVETLTGFKYVSRVPGLVFGFEEALGYLVNPSVVRDKDGISAALVILDIAQDLANKGLTLWDYLATIEKAVGGFASGQITIQTDASSTSAPLTDRVRALAPTQIGPRNVVACDDFLEGVASFPRDNILRFILSDGSRVIIRPSGTEPKVKVYLDTTGATRDTAEAALASLERDVREILATLT